MLKIKNVVVTREQQKEAKELHDKAYEEYVERRNKAFDPSVHSGFVGNLVYFTKVGKLTKPKSMKQCVREVLSKTTGEENGI
jgi:hypothetical protein